MPKISPMAPAISPAQIMAARKGIPSLPLSIAEV